MAIDTPFAFPNPGNPDLDNDGEVNINDLAILLSNWLEPGIIAARVKGKLLYDAKTLRFTNSEDANKLLTRNPRDDPQSSHP